MKWVPAWAGTIAALMIVLALTALFDRLELARFLSEQRAAVTDRLSSQRATLEASLNARLHLVRGLAAFIHTGDTVTEQRFSAFARSLLGDRTDVRSLVLAPNNVIRHVYPLKGNSDALGVNLLAVPRFEETIRLTIETSQLTVAGPAELVQGGVGLLGRIPVFLDKDGKRDLWGLAIIVLDMAPLLAEAGLLDDAHLKHAIRGSDGLGADGEVFFGDAAMFDGDAVLMDVSIPSGTWQLAATPAGGWPNASPHRQTLLAVGFCLALVTALVVHGLLSQAERLHRAIAASQAGEAELRRVVDCLATSNSELERFAYVASHDLQEPLRTITSFAQLLDRRSRSRLTSDDMEYLDFIVGGAKRMHYLVNDLLAYSRVTNRGAPFSRVDTVTLVGQVLQTLHESIAAADAHIFVGSLPPVLGDDVQLTHLFQNLIGNAVKFRRPNHAPIIAITATLGPSGAVFSVSDDGIGIDPEYRDQIFTIFKRLHPADIYPGTGVGLAICKRIVDRHGGRIWAEASVQGGAAFAFTLTPAIAETAEPPGKTSFERLPS
ncbi:MAG: CHASE domain-containing protein [Rhodospirillaceae bacterium]|nr:CHASE domain-containing protein [Rhodospirillales bacterium]